MSRPCLFLSGAGFKTPLLLPAIALALLPLQTRAQTPSQRVEDFAQTASGFTLLGSIERGALQEGREIFFPVQMVDGTSYMIVGFCDADCTDLDLVLRDPDGVEVTSDLLPDAQPILSFTAEASGLFQVQVVMATCSVQPCSYAVGVYVGHGEGGLARPGDMDGTVAVFREELEAQGYVDLGDLQSGGLEEGREIRFPLPLQEGIEYRILGVCDEDCDDLDLRLLDPEGTEVQSDLLSDAIPSLVVTPSYSGEYRVAVIMVSCAIEPCAYRVTALARGEEMGQGGAVISGNVLSDITHEGTLSAEDQKLREGEYFDEFALEVEEGQKIIVDLRSADFDTYLILEAPGGDSERNDDYDNDMQRSHVEMIAPETGSYAILVTSFSAGETGSYTLRLVVTGGS